MAEYINRASLMGKLTAGEVQTAMREMDGSQAYSLFLILLNSEPAADVAEAVRCKDCKWGVKDDHDTYKCTIDAEYLDDIDAYIGFCEWHDADHFCAYGERRSTRGRC